MRVINMKFQAIATIFLISGIMGCSEGFLDVPVEFTETVEEFYDSDEDMVLAVSAAYSSLGDLNLYSRYYHLQKAILTNDVFSLESSPQFTEHYDFNFNPSILEIKAMWHSLYEGVFRCNNVLVAEPTDVENPELVARIRDEARFLRALYYWHIWTNWRNAPLRTTDNMKLFSVGNSEDGAIYDLMVSDLMTVIDNDRLPYIYSGNNNEEAERATLGAARALLGRIYLYNEEYDKAVEQLEIVANRAEYELMPEPNQFWNINFEGNDNKEVLYATIFSKTTGYGVNPNFSDGFGASEGSQRKLYIYRNNFYNLTPTQALIDLYDQEPADKRRKANIILDGEALPWGGTYNFDTPSILKGITELESSQQTGEDFPIIRLADVYLMLAEALHLGSGSDADAFGWIDLVRERAFGAGYVNTEQKIINTGKDLMTVIKEERRKELSFECLTFNDMRRWGDLDDLVDRDGNPRFISGHEYWPIPQGDILRSGGLLKQDPNY